MYKTYQHPQLLEILTYEVDEEYRKEYLKMDHEVWSLGESKFPGYIGKDTWISKTYPNQITHIIYWESKAAWDSIPESVIHRLHAEADQLVPKDKIKRICAYHLENELQKIIEYRNDCQLYDADDEKDC